MPLTTTLFDATLLLHVLAGTLALGAGGFAAALRKGGTGHRRAGRLYGWSMLLVTLTALVLVTIRPSTFLLAVALFSFYLVFTGWRAAVLRDGRPRPADAAATLLMLATGAAMAAWGASAWLPEVAGPPQAPVLLAFGGIGLALAAQDLGWLRRGGDRGKARIARHLGRMLGGMIATITATLVVNFPYLPAPVVWLGPTLLLTPVIAWWSARVLRGAGSGAA